MRLFTAVSCGHYICPILETAAQKSRIYSEKSPQRSCMWSRAGHLWVPSIKDVISTSNSILSLIGAVIVDGTLNVAGPRCGDAWGIATSVSINPMKGALIKGVPLTNEGTVRISVIDVCFQDKPTSNDSKMHDALSNTSPKCTMNQPSKHLFRCVKTNVINARFSTHPLS